MKVAEAVLEANVLLARRRQMGALTVEEQTRLARALQALAGARVRWRAHLGDWLMGEGETEEAALADAVACYQKALDWTEDIPDADTLRHRLTVSVVAEDEGD